MKKKSKRTVIRCFRCAGIEWERLAVTFFPSCVYLILRCVGCHLEIAHKVPRPAVAGG